MRVLSVDPGYSRVGIAIVEKVPRTREHLVYSDCIETDRDALFEERLLTIGRAITGVIKKHAPDFVAIEKIYFEKNQKTAMQVAEARGVIRYIAALHKLPVHEYTPLEIKAAVAGDGHGSKEQIMRILPKLIRIEKDIRFDDEYDAIAVGLTCLATVRLR
ncbi:MAG TPA: crossover junction endodeoxyribonuclease RuvC [Candidatus Paceibacterota bacterium]|jgi:crossover junction endodeoxyribonuclease RuvC